MERDPVQYMLSAVGTTPFKSTRLALAQIRGINDALETLRFRGALPAQLAEARYAMAEASKIDLAETVAAEIADRTAKMERVKARHIEAEKRTRVDRNERRETLTRRYKAMADNEITAVTDRWMLDESSEPDPEMLDQLSAELRDRDPVKWGMLREKMIERWSYEPWRKTGQGAELAADLAVLAECREGYVPLTVDGKRSIIGFENIGELVDGTGGKNET